MSSEPLISIDKFIIWNENVWSGVLKNLDLILWEKNL